MLAIYTGFSKYRHEIPAGGNVIWSIIHLCALQPVFLGTIVESVGGLV